MELTQHPLARLPYPGGDARAIADDRANGMKLSGVVLIVLAGHFDWPDPTVYATPGQSYRWDWLRGLSVVMLIDSKTCHGEMVADIESAEPLQLDMIDIERRLGWTVTGVWSKEIKTVRWTRFMVDDWLGAGSWHREIDRIKVEARPDVEAKSQLLGIN